MRTKRSALYQKATVRLQETEKTVWQLKKKDPPKKHRLEMVRKEITSQRA